jgi:hypothetical protein
MVSFINTWHLQWGRTNPEYSIVFRKTYLSGGNKKTPMICKAIWLVGLLHLQEALPNVHPYFQFLLAVIIVLLANHSM